MIENVMIFSKETKSIVLSTTLGKIDPKSETFLNSLEKIREIAIQLEKGVFILELELSLKASILAIRNLSIATVFTSKADKKAMEAFESVAKEIITGFEKIFSTKDPAKILAYKDTMDELIHWHLKEQSPIDKMKEAFW